MSRTIFALFLAGACAAQLGACSKDSPSSASHNAKPSVNPATTSNDQGFNHTQYPVIAVTGTGPLGKANGGSLTNSAGDSLDIESTWSDGAALVVFYRGHW